MAAQHFHLISFCLLFFLFDLKEDIVPAVIIAYPINYRSGISPNGSWSPPSEALVNNRRLRFLFVGRRYKSTGPAQQKPRNAVAGSSGHDIALSRNIARQLRSRKTNARPHHSVCEACATRRWISGQVPIDFEKAH